MINYIQIAAMGSIGALVISLFGGVINFIISHKILTNDLVHIAADIEELKLYAMRNGKRLDDQGERVARLEGIVENK